MQTAVKMFCVKCGTQLPEGAPNCTSCGEVVAEPKAIQATVATNSSAAIPLATKACPYCGEQILQQALRCKHCQASLTSVPAVAPAGLAVQGPQVQGTGQPTIVIQNVQTQQAPVGFVSGRYKNPTVALLLSIIFPGGGQFYNGHIGKGLLVLFTFWLIIPWIWSIFDAYHCAHRINRVGF